MREILMWIVGGVTIIFMMVTLSGLVDVVVLHEDLAAPSAQGPAQ